jgi:hypothetical protein
MGRHCCERNRTAAEGRLEPLNRGGDRTTVRALSQTGYANLLKFATARTQLFFTFAAAPPHQRLPPRKLSEIESQYRCPPGEYFSRDILILACQHHHHYNDCHGDSNKAGNIPRDILYYFAIPASTIYLYRLGDNGWQELNDIKLLIGKSLLDFWIVEDLYEWRSAHDNCYYQYENQNYY